VSQVGGKSRTIIPINLPKGTTAWYYSFSTSVAGKGTKNLQLLSRLATIAADPSSLSSNLIANIKLPTGSHTIDVYLLENKENADAFIDKVDNSGGIFYYNRDGSVTATKQGIVNVSRISTSTMYLGIKNPSPLEGIDVIIEVVAIVPVQVYEDKWTVANVNKIYSNCLSLFSFRNAEVEQICNCMKNKITTIYRPSEFLKISASNQTKLYKDEIANCAIATENTHVLDKDKKIKSLHEQLRGQTITKDYVAMEQTLIELIQNGVTNYDIYNSLGWTQLCLKKYEEAKKALQTGLGKSPKNLFLLGNLGNYYLLTGQYGQAIALFKEHKKKKIDGKKKFKDAIAEDLREFERLGLGNANFAKIRKELKIK